MASPGRARRPPRAPADSMSPAGTTPRRGGPVIFRELGQRRRAHSRRRRAPRPRRVDVTPTHEWPSRMRRRTRPAPCESESGHAERIGESARHGVAFVGTRGPNSAWVVPARLGDIAVSTWAGGDVIVSGSGCLGPETPSPAHPPGRRRRTAPAGDPRRSATRSPPTRAARRGLSIDAGGIHADLSKHRVTGRDPRPARPPRRGARAPRADRRDVVRRAHQHHREPVGAPRGSCASRAAKVALVVDGVDVVAEVMRCSTGWRTSASGSGATSGQHGQPDPRVVNISGIGGLTPGPVMAQKLLRHQSRATSRSGSCPTSTAPTSSRPPRPRPAETLFIVSEQDLHDAGP